MLISSRAGGDRGGFPSVGECGSSHRTETPTLEKIFMKLNCVCGKSYYPNQSWIHKACVANTVSYMDNDVANSPNAARSVPNKDDVNSVGVTAGETATYKYRDVEKRRAYQREYMRRRRAGV